MYRLGTTLAILGLTAAIPTLNPRQDPKEAEDIDTCRKEDCTDCPLYVSPSDGWPQCLYYTGSQITDAGFPVEPNGMIKIWMNAPKPADGCQTLFRSPVTTSDSSCGGNAVVVQGEACVPITIDNTFIVTTCCGAEECEAAGAPLPGNGKHKRMSKAESAVAGGGKVMLLHDKNGNVIEPHVPGVVQKREVPTAPNPQSRSVGSAAIKKLSKRDCDGFEVTAGPYASGGQSYIISNTVACTPDNSCFATLTNEVTQTTTISTEVSVGDPFGILSASIGFEVSESISQSFSGQYEFGPGERGYLTFIPILKCVEGKFTGDCDDSGKQVTLCGPQPDGENMQGEQRAVIIRG
ncbi:hypothetical protein M011DRAFT_458743 [Sporormia fimetaria CBS 119925]|uniref:Uncharacterized protein n=1 Tax=Sporormia fimetaria CBS 119925 TaxID=1340428 RepID=A0A6A6VD97_9PLEO|nr:hypothetical protein M011DRAFT_458743 [Sporormia fimetaria CBS 119925]